MRFLIFFCGFLVVTRLWGLDPSSEFLLPTQASKNLQEEAISSGRYSVKENSEILPTPEQNSRARFKKKILRKIASEPVHSDLAPAVAQAPKPEIEKPVQAPSYADQVKDLVLGKSLPEVQAYREQVHPDDIRLNRFEINIAPGLIYMDSKSTESYRNYISFSPVIKFGGEIWWTPFIGLFGNYGSSLGADVKNGNQTQSNTSVNHELIDGGLDFRQFFGLSRKSNSITFGLHYFESKFSPPADSVSRTRTKTSGFGIHFESRFPTAPSYAWILGAKIDPRVSHAEFGTSLGLQSGTSVESSRWGFHFGGEFKLSRQNQMIWDIAYTLEKNQFAGSSNLADPETNTVPSGVGVTNGMSFLTLGYRWGH